MKKPALLLTCLLLCWTCLGQQSKNTAIAQVQITPELFRQMNLAYVPGSIQRLIREEVQRLPAAQLDALRVEYARLLKFDFRKSEQRKAFARGFLTNYEKLTAKAEMAVEEKDSVFGLRKLSLRYGNHAVNQNFYTRIPANMDEMFRGPAIVQLAGMVMDTLMVVELQTQRVRVEELITKRITLLSVQGSLITDYLSDPNALKAKITGLQHYNNDAQKVFKNGLGDYAYHFINKKKDIIRDNHRQLRAVVGRGGSAAQQIKDGFDNVVYEANENIGKASVRLERTLENELDEAKKDFSKSLKTEVDKVEGQMKRLADNEKKINGKLLEIQDRIEKNSKKIKTLGKNLGEGIGVQDLADYTKLVNQNSFWVKVVDTYVNGKIYEGNAMEASLNILNTDFAGQIFGVDKIDNYKKELSELQSTPTFTNAAQAVQFAETGIQGLAQLGILKGKDLENAAKFMFYANAAIKVGSGIAGAMNGNPLGLVDALGAMGSLFGGKPQPSPEVQMLQEVLNQLSGIREDLARMETKIDKLNENLIKAYEALSAQIEALREETQAGFKKVTEEIKETRKILITLSDVVLKYNGCQLIDEVMQKSIDSGKLNTYSSWKKAFNDVSGISDCVQMPSMFASDISNTISICAKDAFSDHSFAKAERKAFEEARGLFLLLYDDEMAHLLSIPVSKFSNIQKLAFGEQNLPDESGLEARYIYPPALHILTERFTRYEPFRVAFYGNSFMPLDRYISKDGKTTDFDLSIEYTKNLIEATDKALRQQSVLSGNLLLHRMYSILFYSTDSKSSDESKKKIIECLNTNPVLAYNFVRYVISRDSGPTQHLMRVYNDIIALQDKNIVNENLKKIMSGSSQIYNEGQPLRATGVLTQLEHNSKKIVLKITYKADFAAMAIPNPIELSDDEMMYTDGLNMLLEVKRKLLSHLIELEMVRGMSKPDSPVSNDELKYMMLLKTDW